MDTGNVKLRYLQGALDWFIGQKDLEGTKRVCRKGGAYNAVIPTSHGIYSHARTITAEQLTKFVAGFFPAKASLRSNEECMVNRCASEQRLLLVLQYPIKYHSTNAYSYINRWKKN